MDQIKTIHRSLKHSMRTMQGFEEINKFAWEFLKNQKTTTLNNF